MIVPNHLENLQRRVTEFRMRNKGRFPTTVEIYESELYGIATDLYIMQYRNGASVTEIEAYIRSGESTYMGIPCKVVNGPNN